MTLFASQAIDLILSGKRGNVTPTSGQVADLTCERTHRLGSSRSPLYEQCHDSIESRSDGYDRRADSRARFSGLASADAR
jgi:hypothetical protein